MPRSRIPSVWRATCRTRRACGEKEKAPGRRDAHVPAAELPRGDGSKGKVAIPGAEIKDELRRYAVQKKSPDQGATHVPVTQQLPGDVTEGKVAIAEAEVKAGVRSTIHNPCVKSANSTSTNIPPPSLASPLVRLLERVFVL